MRNEDKKKSTKAAKQLEEVTSVDEEMEETAVDAEVEDDAVIDDTEAEDTLDDAGEESEEDTDDADERDDETDSDEKAAPAKKGKRKTDTDFDKEIAKEKKQTKKKLADEKGQDIEDEPAEKTVRNLSPKPFFTLSMLLVIAAIVVYCVFGLAPSAQNIGATVYIAKMPSVIEEDKVPVLIDDVLEIVGPNAEVTVEESLTTSNSYLNISIHPDETIDEAAVVTMLNANYVTLSGDSDIGIESLTRRELKPALTLDNIITLASVYGILLLALLILVSIFVDGKSALRVIAMLLHDSILMFALYVVCRIPSPRMLIAALLVVCIASPYFNITKIAALKENLASMKKRRVADAVNDIRAKNAASSVDLLVVGALPGVAFAAVGLAFGVVSIAYIGLLIFAAYALALYSSTLLLPGLWAAGKK